MKALKSCFISLDSALGAIKKNAALFVLICELVLLPLATIGSTDCTSDCQLKTAELAKKENLFKEIQKKLDDNTAAKAEAEKRKESSLIIKLNVNLSMGIIKRETVKEEIVLLKTELAACGGCNAK